MKKLINRLAKWLVRKTNTKTTRKPVRLILTNYDVKKNRENLLESIMDVK